MANVGVQRVLRLLVFTETQLSARFLHFVIIFCQKMAVFPCNVREARLSACHLKRSMCYWGRRILAYFCLFMLFMEHAVLRYEYLLVICLLWNMINFIMCQYSPFPMAQNNKVIRCESPYLMLFTSFVF